MRRLGEKSKFLLFLFFSILYAVVGKCQGRKIPDSLYPKENLQIAFKSDYYKKHYFDRIAYFRANPLQVNDIIFLGNSITEFGGDWAQRFNMSEIKNRGISGDGTEGVLNRLGEIWFVKPKAVFLLIGINDVFNPAFTTARIYENILRIVSSIHKNSPRTDIYVQTILPTSDYSLIKKIKALNDLLKQKPTLYTILDIHPLFANKSDLMITAYSTDGIHPNEAGYEIWVKYLKKYFKIP